MQISKITNLLNSTWANSTLWFINDTLKTDIITQIGNEIQICNNVTDFLTAIELCSTNHSIRNIRLEQSFFNGTRLGIGTVKNRKILVKEVLASTKFIDGFSNKDSLVLFIISTIVDNLFPIRILSPEILRTTIFIVFDNVISSLEDGLGRTVIFLQQNNFCFRIILLKIQDILHISTTPTVDRLVSIPYYADILETRSQEFNELILSMVGILILINMNVLELLLVISQNIGILIKETQSQHNQVIKVYRL